MAWGCDPLDAAAAPTGPRPCSSAAFTSTAMAAEGSSPGIPNTSLTPSNVLHFNHATKSAAPPPSLVFAAHVCIRRFKSDTCRSHAAASLAAKMDMPAPTSKHSTANVKGDVVAVDVMVVVPVPVTVDVPNIRGPYVMVMQHA